MNRNRRSALRKIVKELSALSGELEGIKEEEEESRDNLPENFDELWYEMDENVSTLGDAIDLMDDLITTIEQIDIYKNNGRSSDKPNEAEGNKTRRIIELK